MREVRVAVLRSSDDVAAEIDPPELRHVVDHDEVGVEVDHAAHGGGEEIGEVDPSVVQGLVQGAADGGGDLAEDEVRVEMVNLEG